MKILNTNGLPYSIRVLFCSWCGYFTDLTSATFSVDSGFPFMKARDVSLLYMPGGGGTPIYGLYRYVLRDRVGFLRFLILK